MSRYARQILVPEMGEVNQQKLQQSHILIVGAGGLGCPALSYLVGAGVGHIVLIDHDRIEESNLHRQPLYTMADIGKPKVSAAAERLSQLNPHVKITAIAEMLDPDNAHALVRNADLVMDCADSFAVSYILSDICKELGKPLISASALGMTGYVGGYCSGAPSIRALFPELPKNLATCATAGVLGPVVGTLGTIQAQMAIGALTDMSPSPLGQMVSIDLANFMFRSFRFDHAAEPEITPFPFISIAALQDDDILIELRDEKEAPVSIRANVLRYQVADFEQGQAQLPDDKRIIFCCRSGLRAWRAALFHRRYFNGPIALIAAGDSSLAGSSTVNLRR